MQIETKLIVWVLVILGIKYLIKRSFDLAEMNLKNENKEQKTNKKIYTEEAKRELEKDVDMTIKKLEDTLEFDPLWK